MTAYWQNGVGLYKDTAGTVPAVADGDPVAHWKDLIGGFNLTTTATATPVLTAASPYKSKPGVTFTGTVGLTNATFDATSNVSAGCWLVAFYRARTDGAQGVLQPTGGNLAVFDQSGDLQFQFNLNQFRFSTYRDECYHGKAVIAIYDGTQTTPANRFRYRINTTDRPPTYTGTAPDAVSPTVGAGLTMGDGLTGAVLEAAYLDRVPTSGEIAAWETWVGATYFAQGQSRCHVLGDSIPHGYPQHQTDGLAWPEQLDGLLPSGWLPTQNVSTIAYRIAQMELQGGTIDEDRDEWRVHDVVILEAGINDLGQGGTAAQALIDMQVSVNNRLAFGFTVYVQTLLNADAVAGDYFGQFGTTQTQLDTQRGIYNSAVMAGNLGVPGWDLASNAAFADPLLGNPNYYQIDLVHLTAAGDTAAAQAAYTLLIGGSPPPPPPPPSLLSKLGAGIGLRRGTRP